MSQKEKLFDAETLRKTLRYYPASGNFYWLCGQTRLQQAGYELIQGHISIEISGVSFYAHRLAWLYMTGNWPKGMIDHINGVRNDNSFANLRDGSRDLNNQNQKRAHKNNKTGYMGVIKDHRCHEKYRATIYANGKKHQVGVFSTPQEAHEAYLKAKRQLHPGCTI
jgi:hypothetical protein